MYKGKILATSGFLILVIGLCLLIVLLIMPERLYNNGLLEPRITEDYLFEDFKDDMKFLLITAVITLSLGLISVWFRVREFRPENWKINLIFLIFVTIISFITVYYFLEEKVDLVRGEATVYVFYWLGISLTLIGAFLLMNEWLSPFKLTKRYAIRIFGRD